MKILRRALLGGAAVVAMVAGAQAGELEALKAQLEALQTRVQTLEARGAALPEGVSLITFERGNNGLANHELFGDALFDRAPDSRGVTIAITPTADLPAPVTTINITGHVRAAALWGRNGGANRNTRFDLWTRGQLNVAMSTDTAIGRVTGGIQMRGTWRNVAGDANVQMRTAWATWQMTDALSLTFGRTNQIATLDNVTSFGRIAIPAGNDNSRRTQMRLTYVSGPLNLRFGIEENSQNLNSSAPDFAGSLGFNMGSLGFRVGGEVASVSDPSRQQTGWLVNAGINTDLGSMIRLNVGGLYTRGLACDQLVTAGTLGGGNDALSCTDGAGNLTRAWGVQGNMLITLTDTVSLATSAGYVKQARAANDGTRSVWTVGSALVWRPVEALQFGVEADYARVNPVGGAPNARNFAAGFAGWFFF